MAKTTTKTTVNQNESSQYSTWGEEDRAAFRSWLKSLLKSDIVNLTFRKNDGTMREMRCTLRDEYLIESKSTTEPKKPRKVSEDSIAVIDLDKNEWRSFRYDSVKRVNFTIAQE
ncbi:DUF2693 domain-containing protein [bacterium]|nr:DUF2693 domain-containing protein [bacterium]